MKISFCILNFYEDWLVCRAISQVYDYVDEILIGDCSHGKDKLPQFIKGLSKCKIVPDPGYDEDHLSWANWRNYVQSFATGDYVLWIDPDEIYGLIMIKSLKSWIKEFDAEAIGFVRVAYADRERKKVNNKEPKIRLWKNLPYIKWSGDIHESPVGYKTFVVLDVEYAHDVNWLPSFAQRIYKLKRQEKRRQLIKRLKEEDLDPWRDQYPDEGEEDAFRTRE